MQTLDPISIPLNQASLIEASAGTGKTYTMANLYLRLILGVGCEPLMVEQILVVTFTKAATQELRDRIRAKLKDVANWFAEPESEAAQQAFREPFMAELYQAVQPKLAEALLRLRIAEREMDLATIFTIDSFCQKMLFQYAFDSGVRLDIELTADESELLQQLSEQTWRELFYPADLAVAKLAVKHLKSPADALAKAKPYLSGILPPFSPEQQAWLTEDLQSQGVRFEQFSAKCKQYWQMHREATIEPIRTALEQQQQDKKIKILNATSYKLSSLNEKWLPVIDQWATGGDLSLPVAELSYFRQSKLAEKASKGATVVLTSPHFEQWDQFISQYENEFSDLSHRLSLQLFYRFFSHLRAKLADYKNRHLDKNFTDMLVYFHQALHGENGESLSQKIRQQFRFAMIDESQDTDQLQYQIFKKIFLDSPEPQGFILIGDPKQSIYKFRGADIFSYLDAKKNVAETFTLSKNWRSLPKVVQAVNNLFDFTNPDAPPFLYSGIPFHPVQAKQTDERLLNGEQETHIYLWQDAYNKGHFRTEAAAEHCAEQIQQKLSQAQQGKAFIWKKDNENGWAEQPLQPQDIAILVRSHSEAELIKNALAKRQLQSVYLSERNSVYRSDEAKELHLILQACLNPYHAKSLLAVLGSSLWGWSAAQILTLKQDENAWESQVEKMLDYQRIWQQQGVLPMLHKLFIQEGIVERLNAQANADRRLTNILHLAELLQQKADTAENENALVRWFGQQIDHPKDDDEQILRLESEENLIKIVTIHKSKGLQYPVVWLPFVAKRSQGADSEMMSLYRDEEQNLHWDFNSGDENVKKWRNQAEYAEDLRLLYVALTRAEYQLHLILPEKWSSSWNAMHYLLTNGNIAKDSDTVHCLAEKGIEYQSVRLPDEPTQTLFIAQTSTQAVISARLFTSKIRETGLITSFTALQRQHDYLQDLVKISPLATLNDQAQDYDSQFSTMPNPLEQAELSPYSFPHSTKVGNLLHRFLEQLDFTQPLTAEQFQSVCEPLQLDDAWLEPLKNWFEQVLNTPFGEQMIRLADIAPAQRLNEWQFYLRLKNRNALPQLNRLLKQYCPLANSLPDLRLSELDGFVKGYVDCIVQASGQFYVIDYKSNFLGSLAQDYDQTALAQTIGQYRYDLQYLLYSLALHRYLRTRLGEGYDYQRDFGGVAYLFLRGMNGTPHSGVFFDKPSAELMDELDRLFG
ncbi:MAG: exodeoxyribonuclease V subunit beta [Pasteurellaceae bacterium]|nr:exodeoxyribonuclease V subunit beta [Pasteurellaceae bacterium]